jgi:hypothetical protein
MFMENRITNAGALTRLRSEEVNQALLYGNVRTGGTNICSGSVHTKFALLYISPRQQSLKSNYCTAEPGLET